MGTGKPDLVWTNPGAILPLRFESFASILTLFGGVMFHMSKGGTTLLDGETRWDAITWGRVVSLVFDEESLFGNQAREIFDESAFLAKLEFPPRSPVAASPSRKRGRHKRGNFSLMNDTTDTGDIFLGIETATRSQSSPEIVLTQPKNEEARNHESTSFDFTDPTISTSIIEPASEPSEVKIDSKSDFQSAMREAMADLDDERKEPSKVDRGARRAQAMIQSYGSLGGNRRWMTAPSHVMSTILESGDDGDSDHEVEDGIVVDDHTQSHTATTNDSLDYEMVLKPEERRKPKQMRVPTNLRKAATIDAFDYSKASAKTFGSVGVPQTDQELETAGQGFLDSLGKRLGLR